MTGITGTTTTADGVAAPTIESLTPSWLRSLRAAGKSPNTVSGYLEGVRLFDALLGQAGLPTSIALITREHVEMFLERQLAQANHSCVEEGEVRTSPMARMRPPAIPEAPVPRCPMTKSYVGRRVALKITRSGARALLGIASGNVDDRRPVAPACSVSECCGTTPTVMCDGSVMP